MRKRIAVALASVAVSFFVPCLSLNVASADDPYPCDTEFKGEEIKCESIDWIGASVSSIEGAVGAALRGAEEYLRKNVNERIELIAFEIKEQTGTPWKWIGILEGGGFAPLFKVELEITYAVAGEYPRCEDGDPCTTDAYDEETGSCRHEKVEQCSFDYWGG